MDHSESYKTDEFSVPSFSYQDQKISEMESNQVTTEWLDQPPLHSEVLGHRNEGVADKASAPNMLAKSLWVDIDLSIPEEFKSDSKTFNRRDVHAKRLSRFAY